MDTAVHLTPEHHARRRRGQGQGRYQDLNFFYGATKALKNITCR